MSNLSPRALALYQAHGPGPVDWERMAVIVDRAVEMSSPQWLPIETAPRDGTSILLWAPRHGEERIIGFWAVSAKDFNFEGWTTGWETAGGYDIGYDPVSDPSHWQPLPDEPNAG